MAGVVAPNIITDGLVLYLDAANNKSYVSGSTTWTDLSPYQNIGVLTNGPTFNTGSGGSIVFDGTNDYVDCGSNASLRLNDVTVEAWIYISANPSDWVRIFGVGSTDGGTSNRMYGLWYNGTNASATRNLLWQRYSPSVSIYATGTTLSLNTWYQVVATTVSSAQTLYLNASSIGSATGAGPWTANTVNNFTIAYAGLHTYHNGRIANVKVYNRGLSAAEILQNYNTTKTRFGL
jgi:hypothetical protein